MKAQFELLAFIVILTTTAYFAYDYGVTSTEHANQIAQNKLLDKLEQKQDEAYVLAIELANQEPIVNIQYRTIEKEVIKYAQANNDKQCVVNDAHWLRIRADAVRAHNRTIGIFQPALVPDDSTITTGGSTPYQRDVEVLAEDVNNLKTCAENAKKLQSLQTWIRAQLSGHSN